MQFWYQLSQSYISNLLCLVQTDTLDTFMMDSTLEFFFPTRHTKCGSSINYHGRTSLIVSALKPTLLTHLWRIQPSGSFFQHSCPTRDTKCGFDVNYHSRTSLTVFALSKSTLLMHLWWIQPSSSFPWCSLNALVMNSTLKMFSSD